MGLDVAGGAEKVERAGKGLTISGLAGLVIGDLFGLHALVGTISSYLLGIGVFTRGGGYAVKKAAE